MTHYLFYITNNMLRYDLQVQFVHDIAKLSYDTLKNRLNE